MIDPKLLEEFKVTPEQVTEMETKYSVPASVSEKFPDLIPLLITTESMNAEEREYWFQVLPIMNEDQIVKLRTILVNERDQLKKIDDDYGKEITKINEAHKNDWNAFEAQEKKKAVAQAEKLSETNEAKDEEALLQQLNTINDPSRKV